MILPILIFASSLIFILFFPRRLGLISACAAVLCVALGLVSLADLREIAAIAWDATLSFVGIVLLALTLSRIGFFEWCALSLARLTRSVRVLFILVLALSALCSAAFANDGAILILTPIVLAKIRALRLGARTLAAFMLASGLVIDFASLPFIFSNLTNILTAGFFDLGFAEFFEAMWLPFLVASAISIALLALFFARETSGAVDTSRLRDPREAIPNLKLFRLSWVFLVLLLAGYVSGEVAGLPVSVFALGGALAFLAICASFGAVRPLETLRAAPWGVIIFSVGLYVVVWGLKNAGLTDYLRGVFAYFASVGELGGVLGVGVLSASLSAALNNLPAMMLGDVALEVLAEASPKLVYAAVIGCDIGPKLTPFGSLATLIWLYYLAAQGVRISLKRYIKAALIITPPTLLAALLALYFV